MISQVTESGPQNQISLRPPMEILLVEDNEDDILLTKMAIQDNALFRLNVVRDGDEAMAYLRQEGHYVNATLPDLLLLDINMPKKNGFEVLDEIKSDPWLEYLPVVMLTTSDSETDIRKSYLGGACSFITKPRNFEKFRELIIGFARYWTYVSSVPAPLFKRR